MDLHNYRLHRKFGKAVVTISGRDHLLGPRMSKASKIEGERLLGEWHASDRSGSNAATKGENAVVELVADYLRAVKGDAADVATSAYRRALPLTKALEAPWQPCGTRHP